MYLGYIEILEQPKFSLKVQAKRWKEKAIQGLLKGSKIELVL
jgi:hypothetical protein